MKIELFTRKGDFNVELFTEKERLLFAEKLPTLITDKQFVTASMVEEEGAAKFDSLEGFVKALRNYKD